MAYIPLTINTAYLPEWSVHEVSHFAGGDGDHAHAGAMESLWERLAARWHGDEVSA